MNPVLLAAMSDVEPSESGLASGRRQHRVHDGRRARPGGAREPRGLAHRQPSARRPSAAALNERLPPGLRRRRGVRRPRLRARGGAAAARPVAAAATASPRPRSSSSLGRARARQGEARGRQGTLLVVFDLQGEEVDFQPGPVLLGRAARPRRTTTKGPAPAHLRRHLADRARRARALHAPARHRAFKTLARRADGRRRGRGRAAEGRLAAARGHEPALRLRRGRDRDHGLPLACCATSPTRRAVPT